MTAVSRVVVYEVAAGRPVPDCGILDGRAALERKREVDARLSAIKAQLAPGATTPERESLKAESAALAARLTAVRDETKRENARRNFAGLGSPLHEAVVARLDAATVAELEQDALARLADRERRSAERKAQKGAP